MMGFRYTLLILFGFGFFGCDSCDDEPMVELDSPSDGQVVGLTTTFRWHLSDEDDDEVYRYEVRLDKGTDACDSTIEQSFEVEERTCLTLTLDPAIYGGQRVEYAVRATDSDGNVGCTDGRRFTVDVGAGPSGGVCP